MVDDHLATDRVRCDWGAAWRDPAYLAYHDEEWGVPIRDERHLYELLVLEGAQAGLSWSTILHKRDGYRRLFAQFVPDEVARFGPGDVDRLMGDASIVRNRQKIEAAIGNARGVLALRETGGFVDHVWSFVDGEPRINRWTSMREVPAATAESTAMSRDLARRGFRFVGPTILYAFMQSGGLVNDHEVRCFRWQEVQAPVEGAR